MRSIHGSRLTLTMQPDVFRSAAARADVQHVGATVASLPLADIQRFVVRDCRYRQALAAAPNSSVNIASIGMTTNLRDLLATKGT